MVSHWKANVQPTGTKGNCVYQVAIPWRDLGVSAPQVGKAVSFALVLNDHDEGETHLPGDRRRIKWFGGIDEGKDPEQFGDITLVK